MIRRGRSIALELVVPVVVLVVWWLLSKNSTSPYFPPLQNILKTFREVWLFDNFGTDVVPSLTSFAIGFSIALVVAVSGGLLLGMSPRARRDFSPLTEFFRAMPIAALVPLGLIVFGPGMTTEVAMIAFASTWPILVATTDGVRSVDPAMQEMARVYGLSTARRIRVVTFPAALPQIMAGIRIALAIGIGTMIIANMIGATEGLGYYVIHAQQTFNITGMWSGIILIGIIGALLNLIFVAIEHRVLRWHRGWRMSALGGGN